MKLAEALIERADLQRRQAQLRKRLQQNAQYQEGVAQLEEPAQLLQEYRRCSLALEQLVIGINQANHRVKLADDTSMAAALTKRDTLKAEHVMLMALADAATPSQSRYSQSEIRMLAAVDVRQIRQQADEVARRYRELDTQVQQANWANEF